jgi:hypothetical protein
MGGAIGIVIALLVFPIVFCLSGALGAAILGGVLKKQVDANHEGSELLDLNK